MLSGTLKFYNHKNGFGYIATNPNGPDVYIEASAVAESGLARLREGDRLSFEIIELPNGKTRGASLKLIERGSVRAESPRVKAEEYFHDANATPGNDPVRYGDPTAA